MVPYHPLETAEAQRIARQAAYLASRTTAAFDPASDPASNVEAAASAHPAAFQPADTAAALSQKGAFDPAIASGLPPVFDVPSDAVSDAAGQPAAHPAVTTAALAPDGGGALDSAGSRNSGGASNELLSSALTAAGQLAAAPAVTTPAFALDGDGPAPEGTRRMGAAHGEPLSSAPPAADQGSGRKFLCACTMVYNSADMVEEWARHHAELGVQHFFVLDNASEDGLRDELTRIAVTSTESHPAGRFNHPMSGSPLASSSFPVTKSAANDVTEPQSTSLQPISSPPDPSHSSGSNSSTVGISSPTAPSSSLQSHSPPSNTTFSGLTSSHPPVSQTTPIHSAAVSSSSAHSPPADDTATGNPTVGNAAVGNSTVSITWLPWPWPKSQEAGLSFCAASSRSLCHWVMFLDVDEFVFPAALLTPQGEERRERRERRKRSRMGAPGSAKPHLLLIRSLLPQMPPLHAIITAHTCRERGRGGSNQAVQRGEHGGRNAGACGTGGVEGGGEERFSHRDGESGKMHARVAGGRGRSEGMSLRDPPELRGANLRRPQFQNAEGGRRDEEGVASSHDHAIVEGDDSRHHQIYPPNPLSNLSLIPPPGVDPSTCVIPSQLSLSCLTFGPSGHASTPREGLRASYTCRLRAPERFKSIVRVDALAAPLTNLVHRFTALKPGHCTANVRMDVASVFHYKYPAW